MQVLASYAVKGGVGKTSAAVNLASLAARAGLRTALWDLDPQAAATFLLRGKPKVRGGTRDLLRGRTEAGRPLRDTEQEGLRLLPADPAYTSIDIDLSQSKRADDTVRGVLRSMRDEVDLAVLDCPPGSSTLSRNVVRAADLLLTPIVPTPLSMRTLDQVMELAASVDRSGHPTSILAFLSMVDRRRALHRDVLALVQGRYGDVAHSVIPTSALVERMGQRRAPLVVSAPRSQVAGAYRSLWAEVAARLGLA